MMNGRTMGALEHMNEQKQHFLQGEKELLMLKRKVRFLHFAVSILSIISIILLFRVWCISKTILLLAEQICLLREGQDLLAEMDLSLLEAVQKMIL